MPFSIVDLVYGLLLPALAAAAVAYAFGRLNCCAAARPFGAAVALVAGFLCGYALLGLGPLWPSTHWHGLPWAVALGLLGAMAPVPAGRRWWPMMVVLLGSVAAAIGWLLVPNWPDLEPSRAVHWSAWTVYVIATAGLLTAILQQPTTRSSPLGAFVLFGTLLATAALLALCGSLRFAQMAGCGAGAALGLSCLAAVDSRQIDLRRIALPFTVLTAGALLVGRVNSFSDVPLAAYLIVPLAPLTLGLAALRSVQRMSATGRTGLLLTAAVTVCVIALAIAAAAELTGGEAGGY